MNAALRNAIFLARPGELDEEVLFEQGLLPNLQAAMTHKTKSTEVPHHLSQDSLLFQPSPHAINQPEHPSKYRATN
ncbi:MAG: hypothetical protein ACK8QZ_12870, partial [Anaerolineales bacterium]